MFGWIYVRVRNAWRRFRGIDRRWRRATELYDVDVAWLYRDSAAVFVNIGRELEWEDRKRGIAA